MQTRRFGRTGHTSTVAIFGAAALYTGTPAMAEQAMQQIMAAGVNHIDIAPGYGKAEELLGPWIEKTRERFFLGCKTTLRTRDEAAAELGRSLEKLRADKFDLYQFHAVNSFEELDQITGPGGALEAFVRARDEGLTDYLGITGHGNLAPAVFLEALRRFDLDTVLFPVNFVQFGLPVYREKTSELLEACRQREVGVMAIKAVARRPWGERSHTHDCWYEPFESPELIQQCVDFTLSQPGVTGLCTTGDMAILPMFLQACENFRPMEVAQQEALIASATALEAATIFD